MTYRLKNWVYRHTHRERFDFLDRLLATQSMRPAQLRLQQQQNLSELITHAVTYSPYYRDKYRDVPTLFSPDEGVSHLPLLRKADVIKHRESLLTDNIDPCSLRIGHTGGSTGQPLAFYYDRHKMELMRAGMCRSYMWSGWHPGQKILNFWGAKQDIKPAGLSKRLDDFFAAENTVGAYEYTESDLANWVRQIQRYRPVLLQGYASILAELAKYVLDQGLRLPDTLKGVYSTAEMLHGWQRALMESAFACKVFNQYGSREIPNIACECRYGNQHVFTDMVYLESIHEEGADKLIVTALTNRTMPFIRYDIGDSGTLKDGDCPCGSPFPIMDMGVCRSNDLIKTWSGKMIYPSYFIHLLDGLEGIKQYQFVQTAIDKMALNILASRQLTTAEQAGIRARIERDVDSGMSLEIYHVEAITRSRSGKHRFVIRDIA